MDCVFIGPHTEKNSIEVIIHDHSFPGWSVTVDHRDIGSIVDFRDRNGIYLIYILEQVDFLPKLFREVALQSEPPGLLFISHDRTRIAPVIMVWWS